jgi:hypothetical protein
MVEKMAKITHEGVINLGDISIGCFVLEDGRRILSGREMQRALHMVDDTEPNSQTAGTRLNRHLNQETLKPYIYKENDSDYYDPIVCYKGRTKINGYEASVLVRICNAFLKARRSETKLGPRQEIIAKQCEILVGGFAELGLIALIDEATGYQHDREKDALQKIIDTYISEELRAWQKTFPDVYYKEIFRLRGWDFTVNGINKRPSVVGTWTNKLIYEQLPEGVFEELKRLTPKTKSGRYAARFFQSLSPETGEHHLHLQIHTVVTLLQASDTWDEFLFKFNKLSARRKSELGLKSEVKPEDFSED